MTLEQITQEILDSGIDGSKVSQSLKLWINRAIGNIATRNNFNCLRNLTAFTIAAGNNSVTLTNFKALGPEKSPVSTVLPGQSLPYPVQVISRSSSEEHAPGWMGFATIPTGTAPLQFVYIENAQAVWKLFIPANFRATSDLTFTLDAYFYPAALATSADNNGVTNHPILCESVVHMVKAMCYRNEDPSDKRIVALNNEAGALIRTAVHQDALAKLSGRSLHF